MWSSLQIDKGNVTDRSNPNGFDAPLQHLDPFSLAWKIVLTANRQVHHVAERCMILENCDCFISLYAPLSLEYVWSADGVYSMGKKYDQLLCIYVSYKTTMYYLETTHNIYFSWPLSRFLLLSKARPRIFNNSYQDIVVLLLLFFSIVQGYSLLPK